MVPELNGADTVTRWVRIGMRYLRASPSSRLDTELLLCHVLQCRRIDLYANPRRKLSQAEVDSLRALLRRRGADEPIAYLTGHKEFWQHDFLVSPAVLIPRSDTEVLVEVAMRLAPAGSTRLLDVGTGSGCVAISLALALPHAYVEGWDVALDALSVARLNARQLGAQNLVFKCCDALEASTWDGAISEPFDMIVANPPYIALSEAASLPRSVLAFEPQTALFAADEGLAFYRALAKYTPRLLLPHGALAVEIGYRQAHKVTEIFSAAGWEQVRVTQDYMGHDRVVSALVPLAP